MSLRSMEISETEIQEIINNYPDCPVRTLLSKINDFDGSEKNLAELYDLLKWIENHEDELAKLRRMVEEKIIDTRFRDVKV